MLKNKFSFELSRKVKMTLISSFFLILLFFIWNNILILDDFNHNYDESFISNTAAAEAEPEPPSSSSQFQESVQKKGYSIYINLDEKQMYVYKEGTLVKTYPCSGGNPNTPSPEGTWKVISKDTWGDGFGGAWLGFNVPWGKYGIHGTVYPWLIGKSNSSKGCIRMLNNDAKELYKMIPHGTTVTIVHNNRPFRSMMDGDVGSDVRDLQKALSKLDYNKSGVDGRYGEGTSASVEKFQKDHKLKVTGVVDRRTYDLIMQKAKALEPPETQ